MKELPPRTTEVVRVPPTAEQADIELAQMQIVSTIVRKPYISEMDLLRLQELFEELAAEEGRKVILFSEWTTMLTPNRAANQAPRARLRAPRWIRPAEETAAARPPVST